MFGELYISLESRTIEILQIQKMHRVYGQKRTMVEVNSKHPLFHGNFWMNEMVSIREEAAVEQLADPRFKQLVLATTLMPPSKATQQCTATAATAAISAAAAAAAATDAAAATAAARRLMRQLKGAEAPPPEGVRPDKISLIPLQTAL